MRARRGCLSVDDDGVGSVWQDGDAGLKSVHWTSMRCFKALPGAQKK